MWNRRPVLALTRRGRSAPGGPEAGGSVSRTEANRFSVLPSFESIRPWIVSASPRKPSSLSSKIQAGSSKGSGR
jgi:hypothetical protein